ncbi:MAG: hypothetical protein OXD31_11060, partial [Chloroflexi bacterium]|nr:hypothetical protein [Chloroflexota bacterium]
GGGGVTGIAALSRRRTLRLLFPVSNMAIMPPVSSVVIRSIGRCVPTCPGGGAVASGSPLGSGGGPGFPFGTGYARSHANDT